jgi:hypothetical protein
MTNATHETASHKAERAADTLIETAAKLGASEGVKFATGYGSNTKFAQAIRNNPEYGRGWHLLTASNSKGNEVSRFAMVQCLKASFEDAFEAAAIAKGVPPIDAKDRARSAFSYVKNTVAKKIEAEEAAREAALAKQALIDAGQDVSAIEAAEAAERGAKKRADVVTGILKSASTDMVAAMVLRAERDAMELDTDKRLDSVIASLTDIVWELGGDEATKAATEAAKKKAKATAPIK